MARSLRIYDTRDHAQKQPLHERWEVFMRRQGYMNKDIEKVINDLDRKANWNGSLKPMSDPIGRNWTLYFCLKRNSKFPVDIMSIINAFLNWIPAGCWFPQPALYRSCFHCGIGFVYTRHLNCVCSRSCLEHATRKMKEQEFRDQLAVLLSGCQNSEKTLALPLLYTDEWHCKY